jgi:hypothetical protein
VNLQINQATTYKFTLIGLRQSSQYEIAMELYMLSQLQIGGTFTNEFDTSL